MKIKENITKIQSLSTMQGIRWIVYQIIPICVNMRMQ